MGYEKQKATLEKEKKYQEKKMHDKYIDNYSKIQTLKRHIV